MKGKKSIASNSIEVFTYIESDTSDLLPERGSKLLFAAYLFHGPGFEEELQFRIGPSKCGRYDVLWLGSDWNEEGPSALAWIPKGDLTTTTLCKKLLIAAWRTEKADYGYDRPVFHEIKSNEKSLLPSEAVWQIAAQVWPLVNQ